MPAVSSFTSKGSTAAGLKTSISWIRSSILPFCFPACAFLPGRSCTVAVTATTDSRAVFLAVSIAACPGVTSPCTVPVISRKSKKSIFPWSRRTWTQPLMSTDSPTCSPKSFINVRSIETFCIFLLFRDVVNYFIPIEVVFGIEKINDIFCHFVDFLYVQFFEDAVSLLRLLIKRLNDFLIQLVVSRDKFPKRLPADFVVAKISVFVHFMRSIVSSIHTAVYRNYTILFEFRTKDLFGNF